MKLWALICYDKGDDKQNINLIFKSSKMLIDKTRSYVFIWF